MELLFTIMGTGCESVTRIAGNDADVIVGRWKDGRIGTVNAVRPYSDYGAVAFRGRESVVGHPKASLATDYRPLVVEIVKFFQTGKPPVSNEETLEIFAFMDAAQRLSKNKAANPSRFASPPLPVRVTIKTFMSKLLEGKFALILGIANKWSLAYAIAQAFSREGATLGLTYLGEAERRHRRAGQRFEGFGDSALRRHSKTTTWRRSPNPSGRSTGRCMRWCTAWLSPTARI